MKFLGDRIRYLRETADLKQKDIADRFNLSENTWSQYETNKRTPDIDTLKKIADFFNVSLDYLLYITDEAYNPREEEFAEIISIYNSLSKQDKKKLVIEVKKIFF